MKPRLSFADVLAMAMVAWLPPLTGAGASDPAVSSSATMQVIERGPFHRVWRGIVRTVDPASNGPLDRPSTYTELADGLHYWDGQQWLESQDRIEIVGDHAVARQGQHQVIFSPNLNTAGAIDVLTPAGKRLRSHPLGLYYYDAESGKHVLLATLKDSIGQLLPPNRLRYPDAFDGLKADVLYIYTRSGFEQDIVLLERPAPPDQFGLNPATTRLQVFTEFIDPPDPVRREHTLAGEGDPARRARMVEPDLVDELLDFGGFFFPVGQAFAFDKEKLGVLDRPAEIRRDMPTGKPDEILVAKRWMEVQGRTVLVESVNYPQVEPRLRPLKMVAAESASPSGTGARAAALLRAAPGPDNSPGGSIQIAAADYAPRGFVLDYQTVTGGAGSYTFLSGVSYYIPNSFSVSVLAAFQPGCVLKYDTSANIYLPSGTVSFQSTGLMPVFTSKDDNLVGETIAGSTGNPTPIYNPALMLYYVTSGATVQHARFRYAQNAIAAFGNNGSPVHAVTDALFQNCDRGVFLINCSVVLNSARYCQVTTPVLPYYTSWVFGSMTQDCGPLYNVANYAGLKMQGESGNSIPDTMGAAGPSHFMTMLNGDLRPWQPTVDRVHHRQDL